MNTAGRVVGRAKLQRMRALRDPRRAFEYRAEFRNEPFTIKFARPNGGNRRIEFLPMLRDLQSCREPNLAPLRHVVERALKRRRSAGSTGKPAMQSDGQHLRRAFFAL